MQVLGFWGIDAVGYRLPGGYTVEWFWGYFYMWLLFDFRCFRCFRDFWDLGWFLDFGY